MYTENETLTRSVYLAQHNQYLADEIMYDRFLRMAMNLQYYGLQKSDIHTKKILDAGCGNSGYFQEAMFRHEAAEIHCLDIGNDWISPLKTHLERRLGSAALEKFVMTPGSTLKIPFPDGQFDVTFSNGVLMHLENTAEAKIAISELVRVTKPRGKIFIYAGFNSGIGGKYVVPAFRSAYRQDKEFREYIDKIRPQVLREDVYASLEYLRAKRDIRFLEFVFLKRAVPKLIDQDLTRFIQNMLQVPSQQGKDLNSKFMVEEFEKHGVQDIQHLKTYIHRKNIRKFVAPFHFLSNLKSSRIIYGGGHVRIIGTKP